MKSFTSTVVVALTLAACAHVPRTAEDHVPKLRSAQALELSQRGNIALLDVRSSGERLTGLVPSAEWILFGPSDPNQWIERKASSEEIGSFLSAARQKYPSFDTAIAVFCNVGSRSHEAAAVLMKAGYVNVSTVIDGYSGNRAGEGLESQLFSDRSK